MGCRQFKVLPSEPVTKNESEQIETTVPQVDVSQNESKELKTESVVVFRNRLTIPEPSIIRNKFDELTAPRDPNKFTIPIESISSATDLILDASISQEIVSRCSTIDSDIPEYSSMTIASDDSERSYSIYRPESSSSIDSKTRAYGLGAVHRFISTGLKRPATDQRTTHLGNWSDSNESHSLRRSISTLSADSEASVIDPPRGTKATFVHTKKTNAQSKTVINQTSSDSDEPELNYVRDSHSTVQDVTVMTNVLVTSLRSASTKLSNQDFYSRGVISETTSEPDEE